MAALTEAIRKARAHAPDAGKTKNTRLRWRQTDAGCGWGVVRVDGSVDGRVAETA